MATRSRLVHMLGPLLEHRTACGARACCGTIAIAANLERVTCPACRATEEYKAATAQPVTASGVILGFGSVP